MVNLEITPKIYIIILNYNSWHDAIECIESVLKSDYNNYQIIVIDNNSPNNSMEYIKSWADGNLAITKKPENQLSPLIFPVSDKPVSYLYYSGIEQSDDFSDKTAKQVIFIQTGDNLGFAGGNNIGIKMVMSRNDAKYIWLLNPDMLICSNTLSELVKCAEDNQEKIIGAVVKSYFHPEQVLFYGGAKINNNYGTISFIKDKEQTNKIDYISGGSFFTNINNFKKFGLLPEEYFLYWEETDWCTMVKDKLQFQVCFNAICFNKISTSIGIGFLGEYYYTLGSLKYFSKYYPERVKYIMIFNILRIIIRMIKFRFSNISAIIKATCKFREIIKKQV